MIKPDSHIPLKYINQQSLHKQDVISTRWETKTFTRKASIKQSPDKQLDQKQTIIITTETPPYNRQQPKIPGWLWLKFIVLVKYLSYVALLLKTKTKKSY